MNGKLKRTAVLLVLLCALTVSFQRMNRVKAGVMMSFDGFDSQFTLASGNTFSGGTLTLGSSNQFSNSALNHDYYTVKVQAVMGAYASGDVVELCILIGSAENHHRFVVKDIGSERTQVPRSAYAAYYLWENNTKKNGTAEPDTEKDFIQDSWFDIKIVVEGTKAYFYVDGTLYHTVTSTNGFKGKIGFRGKNGSFRNLSVETDSILGKDPFASEEQFRRQFVKTSNETLTDGVLKLGSGNLFSADKVNIPQFTIKVQAAVGAYAPGEVAEICINIGDPLNHHRFMIKDIGDERQLPERNAYTKYVRLVNGTVNSTYSTPDTGTGLKLIPDIWFDITVVCNGNKAEMYLNGILVQSIVSDKAFSGNIGLRGNKASFRKLSVTEGLIMPGTVNYGGAQIRTSLVAYRDKNGNIHASDMRQGLRFCFDVPEINERITFEGRAYTVKSHGALIILKDRMLSGALMTVESVGVYPGLIKQIDLVEWPEGGITYKSAYIYNIPEHNKDTLICARAYTECEDSEGNLIYLYSEIQKKSVEDIYLQIIGSGDADRLDEEVKAWWAGGMQ